MAAPVASYVQLPTDTGNSGKKNRTQTKAVGSDTVHEHFMVPSPNFKNNGRFVFQSTGDVVAASSQTGTGSGFYWITNSTANSNVVCAIRSINVTWGLNSTVAVATGSPLLSFTKFTFNNAFTTGTPDKTPLSYTTAANTIKVNSTSSGATVTLVADFTNWAIPAMATTVGQYGGGIPLYDNSDNYSLNGALQLSTGQGLVIFQPQAGTASDIRKFTVRVAWDEIDIS